VAIVGGKRLFDVDTPREPEEGSKVERFAQLLATCQRRVFLYLLGILHNPTDAEEALQETNLVLWRKFDEYQPGTNFDRWACRIGHFEAMKLREKRARAEQFFGNDFVELLAAEADRSLEVVEARHSALQRCLGKLSEQDRQLVQHRYREKATTQSAAEALGRSVQGTRRALHRIRMALLACIERTLATETRA
jgi:RNA polymerase sigma-70 factor (ECF subfamily)